MKKERKILSVKFFEGGITLTLNDSSEVNLQKQEIENFYYKENYNSFGNYFSIHTKDCLYVMTSPLVTQVDFDKLASCCSTEINRIKRNSFKKWAMLIIFFLLMSLNIFWEKGSFGKLVGQLSILCTFIYAIQLKNDFQKFVAIEKKIHPKT